jgi:lipopolysaccharide transport system ATP-binding protein
VSFAVDQGEVVGVVGRNGAGKSTLLKLLCRITEPTEGRLTIKGRVASLLEVGTGFHPELSGRENIFLNGAILGMSKNEIHRKFDEIVSFAEVEKFIDTPVKRYSSGMYVRLAFSVAAHLEPDILIIDEVLAVGDAEFQKKCLGKMDEVSKRQGRTVLFVSHNVGLITALCPSAIWLDQGKLVRKGGVHSVLNSYLATRTSQNQIVDLESISRWRSDERLVLTSLEWLSELPLRHGEPARLRLNLLANAPLSEVSAGVGFANVEGRRILSYDSDFQDGRRLSLSPGVHAVDIEIDALPLAPSMYYLDIGCRSGDAHALDYISAAIRLEIVPGRETPGYIVQENDVRLRSAWTWAEGLNAEQAQN